MFPHQGNEFDLELPRLSLFLGIQYPTSEEKENFIERKLLGCGPIYKA